MNGTKDRNTSFFEINFQDVCIYVQDNVLVFGGDDVNCFKSVKDWVFRREDNREVDGIILQICDVHNVTGVSQSVDDTHVPLKKIPQREYVFSHF